MKRQDIVCISMTTWEGNYMKTIVHIMNQLSRNHRILFVDYPFTHKDLFMSILGRGNAPVKRLIGWDRRLRHLPVVNQNIYHLTLPPIFPTNWIRDFGKFREQIFLQSEHIQSAILKAMREIEMRHPLVINAFNPIIGLPLIGAFNERALIYYCYDEIRNVDWCGKHGGKMEDEFIPRTNAVIVTSDELRHTKSKSNNETIIIKNGVDFDLFNRAHNLFRFNKTRKVVGYLGSIDFRLDYNLLGNLIQLCPHYDFHFVGRILDHHGANQIKDYPNVFFAGPQQRDALPGYLSDFDIGMVPFALTEQNRYIYPLKINEYLAAGLPVISTAFTTLDDFDGFVTIASDTDDFIQGIKDELNGDNMIRSNERVHVARTNDWSVKARLVEEVLSHKWAYA